MNTIHVLLILNRINPKYITNICFARIFNKLGVSLHLHQSKAKAALEIDLLLCCYGNIFDIIDHLCTFHRTHQKERHNFVLNVELLGRFRFKKTWRITWSKACVITQVFFKSHILTWPQNTTLQVRPWPVTKLGYKIAHKMMMSHVISHVME